MGWLLPLACAFVAISMAFALRGLHDLHRNAGLAPLWPRLAVGSLAVAAACAGAWWLLS